MKIRIPQISGEQIISEFCIYVFAIVTILLQLHEGSTLLFRLRLLAICAGAVFGIYMCVKKAFYKPLSMGVLFAFFWLFCYLIQSNPNSDIEKIQYTLLYIGLAMLIIAGYDSIHISRGIVLLTFLYIIYLISIGRSFRSILVSGSSYNYISILLLFALMFYYIAMLNKGKDISLILSIVYFLLCIWAYGRGGIIAAAFLNVALLLKKIMAEDNKWKKRFYILIAIIIIAITFIMIQNGEILRTVFLKFSLKGTTDEARLTIWKSFIQNNNKDFLSFLVGSDISLIRSDHNLHNFALQAYASFGFIGFVVLIFLIIKSAIMMMKQKKYDHLILFTFLLIRASTDRVFFQGYCEIFLYYFLFMPYYESFQSKNSIQMNKNTAY